jgi:D-alanine-D-alanine ligase
MKVGLTYDLREDYLQAGYGLEETAEFDQPGTIDAIEAAIRALGYETDRIGRIQSLVERMAAGDRWDLVFNIAEGLAGMGREAQVPALLEPTRSPMCSPTRWC